MGVYRLNRTANSVGRINVRRRDVADEPNATVWARTTTASETVTLNRVTPTGGTCLVDWGDGQQDTIAEGTTSDITHVYVSPDDNHQIRIYNPERITQFFMQNNKLTVNSAEISLIENVSDARFSSLRGGQFNSADVVDWRPSRFRLYSMPAGYAGTFNSADVVDWRPNSFFLHSMPSDYAGTFNSADMVDWRPSRFYLYDMPSDYAGTFDFADVADWRPFRFYLYNMPSGYAGTFDSADVIDWRPNRFWLYYMPASYSIVTTAGGFSGWTTIQLFYMFSNNLNSTQIDQILADLWDAFPARTQVSGRLRIQWNAVPNGTYQVANPPTTGMEYAYELLNDSQNINPTYKWIEVNTDT